MPDDDLPISNSPCRTSQAFTKAATPLAVIAGAKCSKDHPLTLVRGRPDKTMCRSCEAFSVQDMMWACTMCDPRVAYCEQCTMRLKAGIKNSVEYLPGLRAMFEQKAAAAGPLEGGVPVTASPYPI